jgi:hypothetical protein
MESRSVIVSAVRPSDMFGRSKADTACMAYFVTTVTKA